MHLILGRVRQALLPALALVMPLVACPAARPAPEGPATVTHSLKPYARGETRFRWMDIADNPYSASFRRKFRYRTGQVTVTYTAEGPALRGKLVAKGLKPNFAYQVKLEGRPAKGADPAAESAGPAEWANARLGSVGRWWCVECDANTWVDTYGSSYHQGHTRLGYLLFDFFVTDSRGDAVHEFAVESSFHVLWKVSQIGVADADGKPRRFTVEGSRRYGYERAPKPSEVEIYAEHEYSRPKPGTLLLPPGRYACRLLLTEESFHSWGSGSGADVGGHWAHCLSDEEMQFTIRE